MQGEAIVNKIIEDAEKKAKSMIETAKLKAEEIKQQTDKFCYEKNIQSLEKIQQMEKDFKDRFETLTKIEKSKILLSKKQEMLKDLKSKALSSLLNLEKEKFSKFVEKLIKKYAEKNAKLVFNFENLTAEEVKNLKPVKDFNLTVKYDNKIEKGILLVNEKADTNLIFETLIDEAFEEIQNDVLDILFD